MGDHEIDLIDAEQHDNKEIEEAEVHHHAGDAMKEEVFYRPTQRHKNQQTIKKPLIMPEKSPDMELPGDQGPFYQQIYVDDDKIACTVAADRNEPDDLC